MIYTRVLNRGGLGILSPADRLGLQGFLDQMVRSMVVEGGVGVVASDRRPGEHGGRWEFPGGKVGPDESNVQAATRELQEELQVELVSAGRPLFEALDPGSHYPVVFVPVAISGEPRCIEHSRLTYGRPAELLKLPLAPSGQAFLEFLYGREAGTPDA